MSILLYDDNTLTRLFGNIYYYALSLAYLKRLNLTVVLYTDTLGKALLGYLPYDEIHLLDIPEEIHPRFWASAKMYALDLEPVGSIHIDGDVFIKKPELVDFINNSNWDVICLSYETAEWYRDNAKVFWKDKEFCKNANLQLDLLGAYNTGVLGFKNKELKDKFINGYKNIVHHFSTSYKSDLSSDDWMTPDLVPELKYIYQLSLLKYKVLLVLEGRNPNDIGYLHVITGLKYRFIDKCADTLKLVSPEIYEKTYKLCHNILNKLK